MTLSGQPAHEDVYRSWVELLVDVYIGIKDIQLVGLRALQRYKCMLRNTLEVHHVCVLELLTSRASYHT